MMKEKGKKEERLSIQVYTSEGGIFEVTSVEKTREGRGR
jgi:hypothetical protein